MEKFSYLHVQNLPYIEELFQNFLQNPGSVDPEWRMFFEGVEFAKKLGGGGTAASPKDIKVLELIRAYRFSGHLKADLDPLKIKTSTYTGLDLNQFGLDEKDLGASFEVSAALGLSKGPLKNVIAKLEASYCGHLTAQFETCSPEMQKWMIRELESESAPLPVEQKLGIYQALVKADTMERFIHTRYVGTKRFSLEGGDSLIPMFEHLLNKGASQGVQEIVLGMAHRGRVNVLSNFMGKDMALIFSEFDGVYNPLENFADGDVKYHMGYSSDRKTPHGDVHLSLAFNPSHLEAVDPVVLGMARAKQRKRKDNKERKKVIPILVHGDAAFIGQGVVAETLQLSKLDAYSVGGTIHVVINNQVGFTTSPEYSRSSQYCTDIAKSIDIPVIHVNGDDAEACVKAMDIAHKFRQQFGQDIVIDLVCYRRYGHNEGDEPAFTQPQMYNVIKAHPTPREIYAARLEKEGVLDKAKAEADVTAEMDRLQAILERARKDTIVPKFFTLEGAWKGLRRSNPMDFVSKTETKISPATLQSLTELITTSPVGFNPHPKLAKQLETRKKMVETNAIDWGMGELLAYGSLVKEGVPVRLSGQDVGRGTFTHRHAIFHDAVNGKRYSPLNTIHPEVADFAAHDSPLSEYACLGYEYGNSITDPQMLAIWEGQFGDFANGAQIVIDQFISSAESKWQRMSGLVMLLPHGYEGQGPEHSSARLERFLQLCAQDNIQVCNLTTPAQIFHALRRQVKREFRKPLIVMTPKSLLRHPKAISAVNDFTNGYFEEVIGDAGAGDAASVTRAVFCSGKLYYDLLEAREKNKEVGTAVIRIEQLYPFPAERLQSELKKYPNLKTIVWSQEEPKNMGAWSFISPRLMETFRDHASRGVAFRYVGRPERASPAVGSPKLHAQEQADLIKGSFSA